MELFRALALMTETPGPGLERAAAALGLGPPPTAVEHTDLFDFELYPYASVYLGARGMMGGEARDRVAGFWRALGETPPGEPDHLAVLLAAYAELAERDVEATGGVRHDRWRRARAAFLWEHILSWLPLYLARVAELGSEFYREWSALLGAALLDEAATLPLPSLLPLHLRAAPPLGLPDDAGGDEFLEAITTPVRTGAILARADLGRCAGNLALGSRQGERRSALKSLLGQAPAQTLNWLADEVERQAERRRVAPASVRTIIVFWQRRAAATTALLRRSAATLEA